MSFVKSLYGCGKNDNAHDGHWKEKDKEWTWDENNGALSEIDDPSGGNVGLEITSIPSPWARFDLIKAAFGRVNKRGGHRIDGNGAGDIYDKMVSEALDVGQLFFNYPLYSKEVKIIKWDKAILQNLINSQNVEHQKFADTMQLFLKSNKDQYHNDRLQSLYLMKHIASGEMIGMTSPSSLFCGTANKLIDPKTKKTIINDIHFHGHNKPFGGKCLRLRDRDPEYVKWLHALSWSGDFMNDFEEVGTYIRNEAGKKTPEKKYEEEYTEPLKIGGNDDVVIVDYKLKRKKTGDTVTAVNSDFKIASDKYEQKQQLPLVLPDTAGNKYADWLYSNSEQWGRNRKAPQIGDTNWNSDWENRVLPGTTPVNYPYLSIDDLLEDKIIRPNTVDKTFWNSDSFFDGNYDSVARDSGYLLPIKNLFFKLFSVEDLKNGMYGTKLIEMQKLGNDVKVILRIPVEREKGTGIKFVEFERTYLAKDGSDKNAFCIMYDKDFDFLLFPNIRFCGDAKRDYRAVIARDKTVVGGDGAYKVEFYHGNGYVLNDKGSEPTTRERDWNKENSHRCLIWKYQSDNEDFDYIRIIRRMAGTDECSGVIVPRFKEQQKTNKVYTFAIDFGTTNTYILYSCGRETSDTFNITGKDPQLATLHYQKKGNDERYYDFFEGEIKEKIHYDFVPLKVEGDHYFPLRTALCIEEAYYNSDDCEISVPSVFEKANVAFNFGKIRRPIYDIIETDLKWQAKLKKNENLVRSYIESILYLIRNKVILLGGPLDETKIIWFYPVSMTQARVNNFEKIWQESYNKYIGNNYRDNLVKVTESTAPFYRYLHEDSTVTVRVTVDIGGGTTDIVLADKNNGNNGLDIRHITSFRFAANAIFSDGWDKPSSPEGMSGIVRRYEEDIKKLLKHAAGTKFAYLMDDFDDARKKKNTSELAALLFSISEIKEENFPEMIRNSPNNYEKQLRNDPEMKIIFVIFYSAIIYHVAQIMKTTGMDIPKEIAFSGNGSKVVHILSGKDDILGEFAKKIFEDVYGKQLERGIDIKMHSQPKRITCEGGIIFAGDGYSDNKDRESKSVERKVILKKVSDAEQSKGGFFNKSDTCKGIKNDGYLKEMVKDVQGYFKCIFERLNDYICEYLLDMDVDGMRDIFNGAKKMCMYEDDLRSWLNKGIEERYGNDEESPIEETLFFYPIIGALKKLADDICDGKFINDNKRR